MKTFYIFKIIAVTFIVFLLFSCAKDSEIAPTPPPDDDTLVGDQNLPYTWRSWMRYVPDSLYLSQMTIPGTHDAGADLHTSNVSWPEWHYVICQDFNFRNQMHLGVRWFDIRLFYHDNGELSVHHDSYYLNKNFDDILSESIQFLNDWPDETIILMIKQEYSDESNHEFGRAVYAKMENHGLDHFYLDYKVPTLGEVRGKIFIVRRFGNELGKSFGIYAHWPNNTTGSLNYYDNIGFYAQDHYSLNTVSNTEKYDEVVNCIEKAHEETDKNTFHINFVSGERVAFGESLWSTADGINYRVENYLKSKSRNWPNCGIIMINFAGGGDSKSDRNCAPYLIYTIVCKNPGVIP